MVRNSVGRVLLLFSFIQLGLEYQSLYLFTWPLNHSCARPPDDMQPQANQSESSGHKHLTVARRYTVYTFNDSRRNRLNPDAVQANLFDAYPDDPFTSARAFAMGINYDDIAGCLQYRREFDTQTNLSSVDLNQLETCPYGLLFEEPQQSPSVMAFFGLACSRRYLTVLLPNSLALGMLAGISLTAYYLIRRVLWPSGSGSQANNASTLEQDDQSNNLYYWFLVQITVGLMIQVQSYSLNRFVALDRIADDDDERLSQQHPELYWHFLVCILLRSFNAASNLTKILFARSCRLLPGKENNRLSSGQERYNFLTFGATFILFRALHVPFALRLITSWWQLSDWLTLYSFFLTMVVFVCELLATGSCETHQSAVAETETSNQLAWETSDVGTNAAPDMFQETTFGCEFCSVGGGPMISILDNPYLPTTTQADRQPIKGKLEVDEYATSTWPSGHRAQHQLRSSAEMPNQSLLIKVVVIMFCLSMNYFILQMIPDHKLLHSETTESMLDRKLNFAKEIAEQHAPDRRFQYPLIGRDQLNGTHEDRSSPDSEIKQEQKFDFRNRNRARQYLEILQDSWNPIDILWTTAKLYSWPLDLFVYALHLSSLSNFEAIYFKRSRLFILIELGAKFLSIEWLVMVIFKQQNHLIEWDWLYTICLLLAHLSSSLMLFNFINSLLKLQSLLATNRLMPFLPNTLSALMAYLLASYAPILERIDLAIIPVTLIVVNLVALLLTRQLGDTFRANLCPLIFENQKQLRPSQQRMELMVDATT